MRVTFGTTFRNAAGELARVAEHMAERQRQVTSGRKIHTVSDNPNAALGAVAERAEMGTVDRYRQTADSATARLTVVDTVLADVIQKIEQASARLTVVQGSNVSQTERDAIVAEMAGIRDAIYSSMTTQFRGAYLFAGTDTTTAPYTKLPGGAVSAYAGDTQTAVLDVDRQHTVQVTFNGDAIMRGSAAADLFTTLETLMTAIAASDATGMAAGAADLAAAHVRVSAAQSRVGTDLASLDDRRAVLDSARRAADTRRAAYEDANMVEAITGMTQAETAYRAALGATSKLGQLSLLDYLR
ncbi:MAG: hypothetical protein AB1635_08915 [Acidobacteriota bacterium]